jgi:hypothetical protein
MISRQHSLFGSLLCALNFLLAGVMSSTFENSNMQHRTSTKWRWLMLMKRNAADDFISFLSIIIANL